MFRNTEKNSGLKNQRILDGISVRYILVMINIRLSFQALV